MQTISPNTAPQGPPSFSQEPEDHRMYWLSNWAVEREKQRIARVNNLGTEATGAILNQNFGKLEYEKSDTVVNDEEHILLTERDMFLETVRLKLSDLTDTKRERLDSYLVKSAPSFLTEVYVKATDFDNPKTRIVSWTTWLAESSTNEQLLNFLQWHIDTLDRQQHNEQAERLYSQQREEYKSGINKGVSEGWLHEDAAEATRKVDDVHIFAGDIFDTILEGSGGYTIPGTNMIVIRPGVGSKPKERERDFMHNIFSSLKHELNHVVLGSVPDRWLNEAITEHIAQAIKSGFPEEVLPNNRPKDPGTYQEERSLLYGLLNYGNHTIPVSLATRAYSDPRGIKGEAYQILARTLDESWGVTDVFGKVQAKINKYEAELAQNKNLLIMNIRKQAVLKLIAEFNRASDMTKVPQKR